MANLLEQLAPTLGSIGGGILGGIGGTFVAPGPGTFAGAVGGAAAGGALGQKVENMTSGSKGSTLGAGVEGGVGQATGEGLAAGAGKAIGALGDTGLVQDAAQKLLQGQLGSKILQTGSDTATIAKTLLDNGVTDLTKAPEQLGVLTGAVDKDGTNGGLFNNGVDSIMNQMKENGTKIYGPFTQIAKQAVDPTSNPIAGSFVDGGQAAGKFIDQTLRNGGLLKEGMGGGKAVGALSVDNIDGADPVAAKAAYKTLRDAARSQSSSDHGKATAGAYNYVANALSKSVLEHPEAEITPEIRADLQAALDKSGLKDSNPKAYANASKTIDSAQNARDLQNAQAPLVSAIKAAEAPTKGGVGLTPGTIAKAALPAAGLVTGGVPGAIAGGAGDLAMTALGSPAGHAATTAAASALPGTLGAIGDATSGIGGQAIGGAAGAGAATLLGQGAPGQAGNPAVGGPMQPPVQSTASPAAGPGGVGGAIGAQPQMSPGLSEPIQLANLASMYDTSLLPGLVSSPAYTNALATETGATKAAGLLPGLESQFQSAGGAQGAAVGKLQEFVQKFTGGPAAAYQAMAASDAAAIAKALGITTDEAEALLPQITQTAQAAANTGQSTTGVLGQLGGMGGPAQLPQPSQIPGFIPAAQQTAART